MSELSMSRRASALVSAARGELSPDAARAARMRARVLAATGVAAAATVATVAANHAPASAAASTAGSATTAAATKASIGLGAKIVLGLVGAAAVATGTHVVDRMLQASPAPAAVTPAPRVVIEQRVVTVPVPAIALVPLPAPAPIVITRAIGGAPAAAHPSVPAPVAEAAPAPVREVSADERALIDEAPPVFAEGPDALARELSEVRGAQAALAGGDGATALVALDAHDRDFPAGQLAEEAGVLRIEALCAVGRAIDAGAARAGFLARFPRSAQRERAARSCGGGEEP